MSPKKLRAILLPTFFVFLLFVLFVLLVNLLIQSPSVQRYLIDHLSEVTGYELHVGKVDVIIWRGIGISAYDVEAKSRIWPESIVASHIRIILDVKELIRGRIVPTKIFLFRPRIELAIKKGLKPSKPGEVSGLKEMLVPMLAGFGSAYMEEAHICIKNFPFELEDLYLNISQQTKDPIRIQGILKGKVAYRNERIAFTLRGTITQDVNQQSNPIVDLKLKTGKVPLAWITWFKSLSVEEGSAEANINIKGVIGGPVSAEGNIIAKDTRFLLVRHERRKDYSFDRLAVDFSSVYSEKILQVSSLRVNAFDFSLTASSKLDFRHTSNPHLSLRVESPFMPLVTFKKIFPTQLLPLWIENRLFPILTSGDVSVELFSLNGTFKQIKKLRMPSNAEVLSMRLAWKELEVLKDGGGLPFKEVSGNLSIENGALLVSGVKANFGRSTVKDARLDNCSLVSNMKGFCVSVDGLFDLQDLLRQREIHLIPIEVRRRLHGFESASGNLDAYIKVRYEKGWDHPRVLNGEFLFKGCKISYDKLRFPLVLDEANLRIDEKGQNQFRGKGLWGKSVFQVSGSVEKSWESGKVEVVARADLNEINNHFYQGNQLPLRFSNLVSCRFSLSRRKNLWSSQGEIDLDGVIMETAAFSMDPVGKKDKILFSVEFQPTMKVYLRNFICKLGESTLKLTGLYDLGKKDSIDFRVSTEKLLVKDLGIRFKKGHVHAKGSFKCQADVRASLMNPLKTSVTGKMEGQGLSFVISKLGSPISDCHFKVELSGKKTFIHFMKMRIGESLISIKGYLEGWDGLKGELGVDADYLDFTDLIDNRVSSDFKDKKTEQSSFLNRSDIKMRLNILNGRWKSLRYGPLKAKCVFRLGNFHIERSKVQLEHGVLRVRGHVKNGKEPEKLFSTYVKMTKQPVKELLNCFKFKKEYLEGSLTLEGLLFMKGRTKKELISSLTGSANLLLEKGKIKESHVIFEILDFLSLQKIFQKRPPELSKEGFYFESIKGHIDINKGIIETDNFMMESPIINAAAKGTVDLTNNWVNYDIGTEPLGTIDLLISKIPIIGHILTGEEKSILVYYFKVKGPLGNPEVRYVPLKNLGNTMIDFFRRLFLTPVRLFKEMSRVTQDLAEKGVPLPEEEY